MFVYIMVLGYNQNRTKMRVLLTFIVIRNSQIGRYMKKNKLLYASALAGLTAASIYGINKTINIVANTKSTLANPNGLKYEWRFGNIFYTKQGSGKPVLLIHDLTCGSSDVEWKSMVKHYAKTNTVYTMDLLGCGRSDKPAITYTNYLFVQLITDFIKNVINHRTDVVASGESSAFVLMACFNDNSLFDKIILINPNSAMLKNQMISGNQKLLKLLIESPIIGTLIYNIINMKKNYISLFKNSYFNNPYAVRGSIIQSYYDASHQGSMSSKYFMASVNSNYTSICVTRAIKDINNSIFIIGSEFEPNIKEILADFVELNPSIETAIIENAKHLPQLEKPNELLSIIRVF